jgi:hypothetical protein
MLSVPSACRSEASFIFTPECNKLQRNAFTTSRHCTQISSNPFSKLLLRFVLLDRLGIRLLPQMNIFLFQTLRVTREYFPLDAAKDLLGPESLVFGFAGDQEFVSFSFLRWKINSKKKKNLIFSEIQLAELRTVMEALITCSQTAVRDIFLK